MRPRPAASALHATRASACERAGVSGPGSAVPACTTSDSGFGRREQPPDTARGRIDGWAHFGLFKSPFAPAPGVGEAGIGRGIWVGARDSRNLAVSTE